MLLTATTRAESDCASAAISAAWRPELRIMSTMTCGAKSRITEAQSARRLRSPWMRRADSGVVPALRRSTATSEPLAINWRTSGAPMKRPPITRTRMPLLLLVAQGFGGVDRRGAPCRSQAGKGRDREQYQRQAGEDQRV